MIKIGFVDSDIFDWRCLWRWRWCDCGNGPVQFSNTLLHKSLMAKVVVRVQHDRFVCVIQRTIHQPTSRTYNKYTKLKERDSTQRTNSHRVAAARSPVVDCQRQQQTRETSKQTGRRHRSPRRHRCAQQWETLHQRRRGRVHAPRCRRTCVSGSVVRVAGARTSRDCVWPPRSQATTTATTTTMMTHQCWPTRPRQTLWGAVCRGWAPVHSALETPLPGASRHNSPPLNRASPPHTPLLQSIATRPAPTPSKTETKFTSLSTFARNTKHSMQTHNHNTRNVLDRERESRRWSRAGGLAPESNAPRRRDLDNDLCRYRPSTHESHNRHNQCRSMVHTLPCTVYQRHPRKRREKFFLKSLQEQ